MTENKKLKLSLKLLTFTRGRGKHQKPLKVNIKEIKPDLIIYDEFKDLTEKGII